MPSGVMCLDDDLPILNAYQVFPWADYGCKLIGLASDGQEGMEKLAYLAPEIFLVDIIMPRMDGLAFIEKAKEKFPSAAFIILSSHCDFEYARCAMHYGVQDYLIKGEYTDQEMGLLLSRYSSIGKEKEPDFRFEIAEAIRLIQEELAQDITLDKLAQKVGMSPNYLGSLFFQQTGEHFRDYLLRIRMERARELILHSPLKIYEVAQQVGIQNAQYFTYLCQKSFGLTPGQMRRKP